MSEVAYEGAAGLETLRGDPGVNRLDMLFVRVGEFSRIALSRGGRAFVSFSSSMSKQSALSRNDRASGSSGVSGGVEGGKKAMRKDLPCRAIRWVPRMSQ